MTPNSIRFATLAAIAGACLVTLPAVAGADDACGPRGGIVERLARQFGETRRGTRPRGDGQMVELFASDATGTWTMAVTASDGRMCLLASGRAWDASLADAAGSVEVRT
nr:hypothetical protein [Jannaschia sp. S6380]